MSEETQVVRPLDTEEIKDSIAQDLAEKIRESLNTTCWLFGQAWPSYRATWRIDITLPRNQLREDYDVDPQETFVTGTAGPPVQDGKVIELSGEIPFTPPNVLRKKHGMPIPAIVKRDDGSTEQKAVVFRQQRGRRNVDAE
jgi:hypothetical protein